MEAPTQSGVLLLYQQLSSSFLGFTAQIFISSRLKLCFFTRVGFYFMIWWSKLPLIGSEAKINRFQINHDLAKKGINRGLSILDRLSRQHYCLCVCIYAYFYIYVYYECYLVCVYVCNCVYLYMCMCVSVFGNLHVLAWQSANVLVNSHSKSLLLFLFQRHACIHKYANIQLCIHTYIWIFTHTHICIYIHTHIST